MVKEKINHLKAGANCAWVPSPTAASLHALHYHQINIFDEQQKIKKREKAKLNDLLNIPIAAKPDWSKEEINTEISNSAQTLLGYVVRWIDQGIGCSKVPDINDIKTLDMKMKSNQSKIGTLAANISNQDMYFVILLN